MSVQSATCPKYPPSSHWMVDFVRPKSIGRLSDLLHYDAYSGDLFWKERSPDGNGFNEKYAGQKAGGLNPFGYRLVRIDGVKLMCHRVVWAMAYGEWPEKTIDHINGNRSDNRLQNLRLADWSQNCTNRRPLSSSGYKGVCKMRGRWQAYLKAGGVRHNVGYFGCPTVAAIARDAKALEIQGDFAFLNFKRKK